MAQRQSFSAKQKLDAIEDLTAKKRSRQEVMKDLNVGASTLSGWIAQHEQIKSQVQQGSGHHKKARLPDHPELDKCVHTWAMQARQAGIPLTEEVLMHKAIRFAEVLGISDFKASDGWVRSFKERHNLYLKV